MTPAELVTLLANSYPEAAEPDKATAMAAYLRDQFPFLGLQAKPRRAIDRQITARGPRRPAHHYLVGVATGCWQLREREYQYFAVDYLRRHHRRLDERFMPVARMLVTTKSWWDTVDGLAVGTIGPLVRLLGIADQMDAWIGDDDVWVARTALLHQIGAKADTDAERLFTYCLKRAGDTDFFIRKAIGWALRDFARVEPQQVRRFVDANAAVLSGLSRREALKHLA